MHIHWKRTLFVFMMAGLGTSLLCVRSALLPDSFDMADKVSVSSPHSSYSITRPQSVSHQQTLDLTEPLANALYCFPHETESPFEHVKSAQVEITLARDSESINLSIAPLKIEAVSPWDRAEMRIELIAMGSNHRYSLERKDQLMMRAQVVCELTLQRPLFKDMEPAYLLLELMYDPVNMTVDVIEPYFHPIGRYRYELVGAEGRPLTLPSRWSGVGAQRALQQIADDLVQIDYPSQAMRASLMLAERSRDLAASIPHPERPWPQSWGKAAPLVEELRKKLEPSLELLRRSNYAGVERLRHYVEGKDFALLFGSSAPAVRAD